MTRQEHLIWCKDRALDYANKGDLSNALISMMSDLTKHEETKNHSGIQLTIELMLIKSFKTKQDIINHINGFN